MALMVFVTVFLVTSLWVFVKSQQFGTQYISLVASLFRLVVCTFGTMITLPLSGRDAVMFEEQAWQWSRLDFLDIFATIDISRSYVFSSIIALFYKIFERNIVIPVFINGILGVLIFYYSVKLADLVWGNLRANRIVAIIVAVHPMLNAHSAVILRENYLGLFIILASIHLVEYVRSGRASSMWMFVGFVLLASCFHIGMIFYLLGAPLVLLFGGRRVEVINALVFGTICVGVLVVAVTQMESRKLELLDGGFDTEDLSQLERSRQEASTAYLVGFEPSGPVDLLWQPPVRVFFLLATPFPWDINSLLHVPAFLDALLWWLIIWSLIRHWEKIKLNNCAKALLICSSIAIVAFAYGTGNYGTAIRHRTKFLAMGLVVVAPFIVPKNLGLRASSQSRY